MPLSAVLGEPAKHSGGAVWNNKREVQVTTTLAAQLRRVFQKFAENASKSNNSNVVTVLTCWRQTLQEPGAPAIQLLDALSVVEAAITRLDAQIANSKHLDAQERQVAQGLAGGLRSIVQLDIFPRPVHDVSHQVNPDRLGALGMLASTLKIENPEAEIAEAELIKLLAEVDGLIAAISNAQIATDLKTVLLRHATYMKWILQNFSFAGLQGVYDALALTVFDTHRIPDAAPPAGANERAGAVGLKAKLFSSCEKIMFVVKFAEGADRGYKAGTQLAHDAAQIVQTFLPPN